MNIALCSAIESYRRERFIDRVFQRRTRRKHVGLEFGNSREIANAYVAKAFLRAKKKLLEESPLGTGIGLRW